MKRHEVGNGAGDVFFYRYIFFMCRPFSIMLHQFVRSDHERCLHDHPWPFVTIILWGGYWEYMKHGRFWRRPGSILYRTAETAHRIEIEPGTRPWSLVFVGRKSRAWGFWEKTGWKPWREGVSPICEDTTQ